MDDDPAIAGINPMHKTETDDSAAGDVNPMHKTETDDSAAGDGQTSFGSTNLPIHSSSTAMPWGTCTTEPFRLDDIEASERASAMELPGLCSELPAEDSPTGTTWKAVVNHGGGDDDTSQSSSSVTKRKKRRRPRGGKREEGNGDDAATRGCASPVTVTSPVMVGESSEQTQQLSANASFRVVAFVSRVRTRIRRSHELLAKRLGMGLLGLSIAHKLTLVYSFSIGNGGLLCDKMTKVLSISAFLLHTGLALPHIGMRRELWVHYCVLVMDCFIRGVKLAVQREFSWAVYNVVAWGFCLYPAGGWGLHQFLNAVQQQEATTRDAVARCAVVTLVANAMPILYFALNGLLCVGFSRDPGQFCGIRVYVNDAAIFALLGTAMLAIMLTLQPISQKQMARLEDIPTQ